MLTIRTDEKGCLVLEAVVQHAFWNKNLKTIKLNAGGYQLLGGVDPRSSVGAVLRQSHVVLPYECRGHWYEAIDEDGVPRTSWLQHAPGWNTEPRWPPLPPRT
jgi:hypothetical protein